MVLNAEPRIMHFIFLHYILSLLMFHSTAMPENRKDISHMEHPRKRNSPLSFVTFKFNPSLSLSFSLTKTWWLWFLKKTLLHWFLVRVGSCNAIERVVAKSWGLSLILNPIRIIADSIFFYFSQIFMVM